MILHPGPPQLTDDVVKRIEGVWYEFSMLSCEFCHHRGGVYDDPDHRTLLATPAYVAYMIKERKIASEFSAYRYRPTEVHFCVHHIWEGIPES